MTATPFADCSAFTVMSSNSLASRSVRTSRAHCCGSYSSPAFTMQRASTSPVSSPPSASFTATDDTFAACAAHAAITMQNSSFFMLSPFNLLRRLRDHPSNFTGSTCQIFCAYSNTARSLEKRPERAMFTSDIAFHFWASRYVASTRSCASQ